MGWTSLKNLLKELFPKRMREKVKYYLLYYYVFLNRINPIDLQKICFFYKPEVPNFGPDFLYLKLGKKENVSNPNSYTVVFEADLPNNLSRHNEFLFDYTGLYALYSNNLITKDHILLIHYDTHIRHPKWIEIISSCAKRNNVIFSNWAIDDDRAEVCRWVYQRIDDVFLATHKRTFLSYLKENNRIQLLPNTSQFCCKRETFVELMNFLLPIYKYILEEEQKAVGYAHLLERSWGLFFAIKGYTLMSVINDGHSQSKTDYGESARDQRIPFPLLTTALDRNVTKFSEVIPI
jgi:hypothetical protein